MRQYSTYTDEELLRLLKDRDVAAMQAIYDRYWEKLLNETYKRLEDLPRCEEIVQDVLVDLWFNCAKKNVLQLWPYLFTCVRYQVFTHYKKNGREKKLFDAFSLQDDSATAASDDLCLKNDLLAFLENCLYRQPKRRQEIFQLRFIEGYSTKEISEKMGISQNTVQNQLSAVVSIVRNLLTKHFLLALSLWLIL